MARIINSFKSIFLSFEIEMSLITKIFITPWGLMTLGIICIISFFSLFILKKNFLIYLIFAFYTSLLITAIVVPLKMIATAL